MSLSNPARLEQPSVGDAPAPEPALCAEVARLIVESLQLEVQPADIDLDGRLFGEGLGLDSIDALELALAISRRYGFDLKSDDEKNHQIFRSLRSLAAHIGQRRTR